ncbi:MAG: PspA-associated protein PspAA [Ardenticatenaceae bacterium]
MIVRIASEGQYRLSSAILDQLNEIDDALVESIGTYNQVTFASKFASMLDLVRNQGQKVASEELLESDVILPYPDISVEEARRLFIGEGLIPNE